MGFCLAKKLGDGETPAEGEKVAHPHVPKIVARPAAGRRQEGCFADSERSSFPEALALSPAGSLALTPRAESFPGSFADFSPAAQLQVQQLVLLRCEDCGAQRGGHLPCSRYRSQLLSPLTAERANALRLPRPGCRSAFSRCSITFLSWTAFL